MSKPKFPLYGHAGFKENPYWLIDFDSQLPADKIMAFNDHGKISFRTGKASIAGSNVGVNFNGKTFSFFFYEGTGTIPTRFYIAGDVTISGICIDFTFHVQDGDVVYDYGEKD